MSVLAYLTAPPASSTVGGTTNAVVAASIYVVITRVWPMWGERDGVDTFLDGFESMHGNGPYRPCVRGSFDRPGETDERLASACVVDIELGNVGVAAMKAWGGALWYMGREKRAVDLRRNSHIKGVETCSKMKILF
jgi:hypothetical protein